MAQHLWFFAALGSALLWGFSYALSEKLFKHYELPLPFFMMMTGGIYFAACIGMVLFTQNLKPGLEIVSGNHKLMGEILIVALTYVIGAFLIFFAISEKNATLANLIEISYPVFTLIFAWFLFREIQINWQGALGGLLIFSGIGLIFWKS